MGAGGIQCYLASKAKYLESIGWHVVVFSDNNPASKDRCLIDHLNKYLPNGNPFLGVHPNKLPSLIIKNTIESLVSRIGIIAEDDEIVIESCDDITAVWGELLASRIKARHFFWAANEHFRGGGKHYEDFIDFFMFKMDRGEVFASIQSANRLFEGFRTYKNGDFEEYPFTEDPILDIFCPRIASLTKKDYSICYIGRSRKPYFPSIVNGVKSFSNNHPEKGIQFVIVGEVTNERRSVLDHHLPNLSIVELGNLFPLPRMLYSKVDVVIAGSGSARHSMDEGALVITADPEKCLSHGLLGYDTNESIYENSESSEQCLNISFSDALERALVKQTWRIQQNIWKRSMSVGECTAAQLKIIDNANKECIYYDLKRLVGGSVDWSSILGVLIGKVKVFIKNIVYCVSGFGGDIVG